MKKFKCKSCGKIHDAKPSACSCDHTEFEEITTEENTKPVEKVDLEAYAKTVKAEAEAELRIKIEKELNEKNAETSKTSEAEMRAKILKELDDKKEEANQTDEQIKISNLTRMLEEQSETINLLKNNSLEQAEEVKQAKIEKEINKRLEKDPYLKKLVQKYLDNGTIKSLDQYDAIVTPELRKVLKEKAEIEEMAKKQGADPESDYTDNNVGKQSVKNKDWKQKAKEANQDEVNKLFGIRPTTKK